MFKNKLNILKNLTKAFRQFEKFPLVVATLFVFSQK